MTTEFNKEYYKKFIKMVIYITSTLGVMIIFFYGLLALIPAYPFDKQNILLGVLLILFCVIGIFPGFLIGLIIGGIIGLPVTYYKSNKKKKEVDTYDFFSTENNCLTPREEYVRENILN